MFKCIQLNKIDLSLSNLTTIDLGFLTGCKNLREIDLSKLPNLTTIGKRFMHRCLGINTPLVLANLLHLIKIDNFRNF